MESKNISRYLVRNLSWLRLILGIFYRYLECLINLLGANHKHGSTNVFIFGLLQLSCHRLILRFIVIIGSWVLLQSWSLIIIVLKYLVKLIFGLNFWTLSPSLHYEYKLLKFLLRIRYHHLRIISLQKL